MGKTVTYVITAILLGMVAMLPVLAFPPKRADTTDQPYYTIEEDMNLLLKGDAEKRYGLEEPAAVVVPSGPFHIGLILVIGFVFAFGVSFYFKRRIF